MSRIRTIKPELWDDEKLGQRPRDERLLFIGLFSKMADDQGRFRAHPSAVRSGVFPYDDDIPLSMLKGWLEGLESAGFIGLYDEAGQVYGAITNWHHQKVTHPAKPRLPAPTHENLRPSSKKFRECLEHPGDSPKNSETFTPHTSDLVPSTSDPDQVPPTTDSCAEADAPPHAPEVAEKDKDQVSIVDMAKATPAPIESAGDDVAALEQVAQHRLKSQTQPMEPAVIADPPDPVVMTFPVVGNGATEWELRESFVRELREAYPGVDTDQQLREARAWCVANTTRRKTASGMKKFLNGWMSRVQNSGGSRNRNGSGPAPAPTPRPPPVVKREHIPGVDDLTPEQRRSNIERARKIAGVAAKSTGPPHAPTRTTTEKTTPAVPGKEA